MALRRIQTGRGGPSVNSVLGRLRGTRRGAPQKYGKQPDANVKATLTTALAGAQNDLTYTAVIAGTAGNGIRIRYVNAGATQALAVSKSGDDITVNLATDGSSVITSTAAQVRDAVNQHPPTAGIVRAANAAANDGTGLVTALAFTALSGGTDG